RAARMRALRGAVLDQGSERRSTLPPPVLRENAPQRGVSSSATSVATDSDSLRRRELEELQQIQTQERQQSEQRRREEDQRRPATSTSRGPATSRGVDQARAQMARRAGEVAAGKLAALGPVDDDTRDKLRKKAAVVAPRADHRGGGDRRMARLTVQQALSNADGGFEKVYSVASMRRKVEREKRQMHRGQADQQRVARDVVVPEVITVGELANRMAERGADVIKCLMKMGVMVTITQTIDADTAELVAAEFGHKIKRVADSDVEQVLQHEDDAADSLLPRPPIVTVMGHVDHGKTSLLDALRSANVVAGEAGGITQHIGAYQVMLKEPQHGFDRITFIDTPGHAAFTEMRARGANLTDIVILVVAADDGIMPQTIEAIKHAKAAEVPIVVAINKCDLPAAKPDRVRTELLQHDLQVEEMGGEVLSVEISAKTRKGLDKLLESVVLQAEILDLRANPHRIAVGTVVEAKMERGRGSVATVLLQKGTLKIGDVFVTGTEWGKVRAIINDRGENMVSAGPAMPVEVLGLNGTPHAGDDFMAVGDEAKAREIADFRARRKRTQQATASANRGSLEQMLESIKSGATKELPVLIKGDVHGSVEAIKNALEKITTDNNEVRVRVLDAAVGPVTESDVTLANASKGMIIGFNVRANPQARELAKRDAIDIRYYSIIYNVIDDVKKALTGLLSPDLREKFLGNASILQVFNITKVGKVAGCRVTDGVVKRGAKVRLLRDNVVIHEGTLKTLKRIKDEVKEVKEGFECGMAFESYDDIKEGDVIECFEIEQVARAL
ncbi:MAG: translation initiation factor IF-2, partial [Alphaproteobacteria bacterium]|nr:translation initiation factor IF-2 [Alphaproteobacteria bacterium]